MKLEFIIPGPPIPWKAPYVGVRGAFSPRTNVMRDFREILRKDYREDPIKQAVEVHLTFYMPIPASVSKKKREQMKSNEIRHVKRPDISNIEKLVHDVLIGCVIEDDSQIVCSYSQKLYGEEPRTEIEVIVL